MKNDPKPLFLVDGTALVYRAHFALLKSNLKTRAGQPTGAVYGFTQSMRKLLNREKPERILVAFDPRTSTFRHALYDQYKATRQKMTDDLVSQLPLVRRVVEAMGIPVLEIPDYEADDVIGTLAIRAAATGIDSYLVTADKDFMQLVNERIRLYDPTKPGDDPLIIGHDEVVARFGVPPDRVIDILGLMGDASDNIPGVPEVGPKTAADLVKAYGNLEAVLERAAEVRREKIRENLTAFREQALLSKRLATIEIAVPLPVDVADIRRNPEDAAALLAIFSELEFAGLAEEYRKLVPVVLGRAAERSYHTVDTEEELDALAACLDRAPRFALDTETDSLEPRSARVIGLSFSVRAGEAFYVPLNRVPPIVPDPAGWTGPPGEGVIRRLRPAIERAEGRVAGQNVKYDMQVLANHGVRVPRPGFDTMLASYLLEPDAREHNLDVLSESHLALAKIRTEELIGRGKDQLSMLQVPIEAVAEYSCEDADYTFRLVELFAPRIEEFGLGPVFEQLELPLIPVLAHMERQGVRVDSERLRAFGKALEAETERLCGEIRAIVGRTINLNSPREVGVVLFEELNVAQGTRVRVKKTKFGWSTDQDVLEALALHHVLPGKILEHRRVQKLQSTYVSQLPKLVDPATGRIHSSFNQAVAATGRLSSSNPNLQNIPIRTELGQQIRKAFVPTGPGYRLVSADYSQVELRIMAHVSEDPNLLEAFRRRADVHRDTAARIFGVPEGDVTSEMRSRAKAINFGIMYGMGAQRLARDTGMTVAEAAQFIERYFATYPRVRAYLDSQKQKARTEGFVATLLGRRRPIADILSTNGMLRANAENMAVNTPIQGSAADLIKAAMIRIHRRLADERYQSKMILQVHDELVFDAPEAEVEKLVGMVKAEMEGALALSVPLVVDVGVGRDWLEAHG